MKRSVSQKPVVETSAPVTQSDSVAIPPRPKAIRWAEANLKRQLFLTLMALYLFTLGGHLYSGDGVASYGTAWSIVEGKGGALDEYFSDNRFGFPGRDGHFFSKYGVGQMAIELPFVVLAKGLGLLLPSLNPDPVGRMLVSTLNSLVIAFSAVVLFTIVRNFGYGVRAGLGVALLYAVGTMAWTYARLDFSEPLITLAYLLMARNLFAWGAQPDKDRELLKVGAWLGVAITIKSAAALGLLPILVYIIYTLFFSKNALNLKTSASSTSSAVKILKLVRPLFWLGIPLVVGLAIVLGYNYYRFGSISETGYGAIKDQFAAGSFYGGIFGFLFSPGKSIFLYSPALIFALFGLRSFFSFSKKSLRAETLFILILVAVYLLFYSFFWNWEGDWTWGPRYLMPAIPFVGLWAAPLFEKFSPLRRQGFYLSICAALVVNALGIFTMFDQYLLASYKSGVNQDWRFIPELSPLRGQVYMLASAMSQALGRPSLTIDYLAWDPVRVTALKAIIPLQGYDEFDVWWLRPANTGNWLIALVAGAFFAGLLWFAWRRFYRTYKILKEFEGY